MKKKEKEKGCLEQLAIGASVLYCAAVAAIAVGHY